jgi:hypothetical protein
VGDEGWESRDMLDWCPDCFREDVIDSEDPCCGEGSGAPLQASGEFLDDYERSGLATEAIECLEAREAQAKDKLDRRKNQLGAKVNDDRDALIAYTERRIYRDAILVIADTDLMRHVYSRSKDHQVDEPEEGKRPTRCEPGRHVGCIHAAERPAEQGKETEEEPRPDPHCGLCHKFGDHCPYHGQPPAEPLQEEQG